MKESNLAYVFAPLETVDVKSLTKVAERLSSSLNKADKAVGSFLLRYLDYKSGSAKRFPGEDEGSPLANLRDLR
ncbi:MAG: hypothetical protein SNJ78_09610 [Spirochaetales bacterium]